MYIHMVIAQGLDAHVMRDIFLPKLTNMGPGAVSALWIFFRGRWRAMDGLGDPPLEGDYLKLHYDKQVLR